MRLFGKGHPAMMAAVTLTTLLLPHAAGAKTFHCAAGDVACLIDSIDQANSNGRPKNTIQLEGGTYTIIDVNNNADGPNGLPSITSVLTIAASQEHADIVRAAGAPAFRLFHVAIGGHLTLEDVSVRNGNASGGAGVLNRGETTIARSTFADNVSGALGRVGAILNEGGVVTATDSTFTRNSGGAVRNADGQLILTDCLVEHNGAFEGSGLASLSGTVRIQ